jgi:eukaryotic-like serine/threonine-protein kinase
MVPSILNEPLRSIGNCDLLEKIADTGLGEVYKGQDRVTGAIVAVKIMPPFRADNQLAFQRFARECRILSALNDPHIIRALDFGIDGSRSYLVMEFAEGESLGQRLAREGRLAEAEAIRLIAEVAGALGRAHSKGLVHRNVKPDKILITADGKTKLTDLGLIREIETQHDLTRAGTVLGTLNFMAPEQLYNANKATRQCDIYSLAATLYMVVTGKVPFEGCNPADMWARKLRNDLSPARTLVPALSERIDRAIRRAMSTEPGQRPVDCAAFVQDLTGEGALKTDPGSFVSDQPPSKPIPLQVLGPNASSSECTAAPTTVKPPAPPEKGVGHGEGYRWAMLLAVFGVVVAGFLSGLFLFVW